MRSETLLLFRVADTLKAKRKMVKKWNTFHAFFKVSLASLYRWDRLIRINIVAPPGGCEVERKSGLIRRRINYSPSEFN